MHNDIIIICPKHGEFIQDAGNHIGGHGCGKCGITKRSQSLSSNSAEFIKKSLIIHGNKFDYSKVKYTLARNKVTIICPKHGEFEQTPHSHLVGSDCLKCSREKTNYERYRDKKTLLYFIYFPEYDLYKIGLTMTSINKRYSNEIGKGLKVEIVTSKEFSNGEEAYKLEQLILKNYEQLKYQGPDILIGGNTELFTENIMIDYKQKEIDEITI